MPYRGTRFRQRERTATGMRALVVEDGLSRQALAATRALAAAGWTVGIASPVPGFASVSTAAKGWHAVEAPECDLTAFARGVEEAVVRGRYHVVLGARDADVLALSALRERIGACVPYPSHDLVVRAFDKLSLTAAAQEVGLPVPAAVNGAAGPVMVKARLHPALERAGAGARMEARHVSGVRECAARSAAIRATGREALTQESLEGQLVALTLLIAEDGQPVARAQQVAERIYPPRAGIDARSRTTPVDEELAERTGQLLAKLGWFGLVHLEFIQPPGRRPCLIDFNGRIYGSIALAVAANVNFPALWADMAVGRRVASVPDAIPDVSYQWLWGDLNRSIKERRRGLITDVADTIGAARGATHSVWRPDDPRPAARYLAQMVNRRFGTADGPSTAVDQWSIARAEQPSVNGRPIRARSR